ncbi:MAG: ABC transporter ATP-binding protein [Patescibacteria group bacterium]
MKAKNAVIFVLSTLWKSKGWALLSYTVLQIIVYLSIFLNNFAFKGIIDSASNKQSFLQIGVFGFLILWLIYQLGRTFLERVMDYLWNILDVAQVLYSTEKFVHKLSSLDLPSYEDSMKHDLMWRAFNRINFQMKYYSNAIISSFAQSVSLVFSVFIFFLASPPLALAIITSNLVPIIIRSKLGEANFNIWKADSETRRKFEYTSMLFTERETLPELKLYSAFPFLRDRLIGLYKHYSSKQISLYKKTFLWTSVVDLLPILTISVFLFSIANKMLNNQMTVGTFVFYFQNIVVFEIALANLNNWVSIIISDSHFIQDSIDFHELKNNVEFPKLKGAERDSLKKKLINPSIRLDSVSFKYPKSTSQVLNNISLTIPYGQNVALIGENGAGKSTLVKLFMRMYDPTQGEIYINDVNLKDIPEDVLMQTYSTLFQNFGKFYLTIRENLEIAANRKLSDEEYIKVLKFSNAWNYVQDFPKKLDQQLGATYKEGIDLSGGQWQQLGIAKAYLKKSPFLILDEPTSAIDAKAEMEIFDRLNKETEKSTVMFISHRFSTIKDAKRILVLDKGEVVEDGTHEELIKHNKKYANLYNIQAERYQRE